MILNRVKLERAVVFTKYIASVIPIIFSPKILIWNKMVLPALNSFKVLGLVENELEKIFSKSIWQYCFLHTIMEVYILEANY